MHHNGLQTYNRPQIEAVQATNSYVMALASSKQMHELTQNEKHIFLLDCLHKAIFLGGWKSKTDQEMILLMQNLSPELTKSLKRMTQAEVLTAFENGAKGYYGETMGISVAGCLKWLNAYYLDQERQKAKKELEKLMKEPPRPKMTRGEKRMFINAAYCKFLKDGFYKDYGNVIYDMIDNERLITFSNDQKRSFLERGRKVVYDQLQNYKSLQEKRENDRKIQDLMDNDKPAIGEAKRIALFEYFKILKGENFTEVPFLETCPKF